MVLPSIDFRTISGMQVFKASKMLRGPLQATTAYRSLFFRLRSLEKSTVTVFAKRVAMVLLRSEAFGLTIVKFVVALIFFLLLTSFTWLNPSFSQI
jgi:hypothetical protein